jgi:hypothetical protein
MDVSKVSGVKIPPRSIAWPGRHRRVQNEWRKLHQTGDEEFVVTTAPRIDSRSEKVGFHCQSFLIGDQ